jgi:hypothetical protein
MIVNQGIGETEVQKFIDELIEFLVDEAPKPDWLLNERCLDLVTGEISAAWIEVISPIEIVESIRDFIYSEEIECIADDKKIEIVRHLAMNDEDDPSHTALCKVNHSDGRVFYMPVECCSPEYELTLEIDSSFKDIKNRYIQINQSSTTRPDGSPLSDAEILKLWDKAVM